jgi:hypothetical protein
MNGGLGGLFYLQRGVWWFREETLGSTQAKCSLDWLENQESQRGAMYRTGGLSLGRVSEKGLVKSTPLFVISFMSQISWYR